MKKWFGKLLAGAVSFAVLATVALVPALPSQAAAKGVTVYFQNSLGWKQVYCYTWYGSGATSAAWPGTEMTSVGNNWYSFTYTGSKPLNAIFSNNAKPKAAQTANHTPADLPLTQSAYWFTVADGSSQNAGGEGGGANLKVNTAAQAGWPGTATVSSSSTASTVTSSTTSAASSKVASPSTGDTSAVPAIALIAVVSLAGAAALLAKKKSRV